MKKKSLIAVLALLVTLGAASCNSPVKAHPVSAKIDLLSATRAYSAYLEGTINAIDSQPDDRRKHEYVETLKSSISKEVSKWKEQADAELRAGTYIKTTSTPEYKEAFEKVKVLAPLLVSRLTKYSQ